MPASQIQVKWATGSGTNFRTSVAALLGYSPRPDVKGAIGIKGSMDPDMLEHLVQIASAAGLDVYVTLTATWTAEAQPEQLTLFDPPPRRPETPTAEGVEDAAIESMLGFLEEADNPENDEQQ